MLEEVLPKAVAVTYTVPVPAGEVAVQLEVLEQLTDVAALVPKETVVPPEAVEKPEPEIVTTVPPAAGPLAGLRPLTTGT